jgi:hypothetical protein
MPINVMRETANNYLKNTTNYIGEPRMEILNLATSVEIAGADYKD